MQSSLEAEDVARQASLRRTFAIISHPDAGKTTLTEKFLLYGGAIAEAGAVKARRGRSATSDWMDLEKQRGISITSTVLQFRYRDHVLNLLDTPGHRDFSEDTYRVLTAADAAIMVLDVAKGIEPQTLKLFEVCRARQLPIITFLNKYDRPGKDPLELLDEIRDQIGLESTPITWPVGIPGEFHGVIDRRTGDFVKFERTKHGASEVPETIVPAEEAAETLGDVWKTALDGCTLLEAIGADHDEELFLAGETSPLFVGSALTNFGVRQMLDAIIDLAPAPKAREDKAGETREISSPFSGFVFKIQANMDKAHRDRVAFVRLCSGRFERGMTVTQERTGKPFATKYASSVFGSERETIDEAFPGDVVGLVNAGDLRVGDTLYESGKVEFPPIPTFAPELFAIARPKDTGKFKQFRKGVEQLAEEGVIQVLRDDITGDATPMIAAVGQMQFEVFAYRLENDYGAEIRLETAPYVTARRTDAETAAKVATTSGSVRVMKRVDGVLFALFESKYWLDRVVAEHPEYLLEEIVAN